MYYKYYKHYNITYFNYEPKFDGVFSRDNLPKIKDRVYVINLDDKKKKEHIDFQYLLTKTQLCTLILLEWNIFLELYQTKSKIKELLATYLEYNLTILFYHVWILSYSFHRIYD